MSQYGLLYPLSDCTPQLKHDAKTTLEMLSSSSLSTSSSHDSFHEVFMKDMREYELKPVARPWNLDLLTEATKAIDAVPAHELPDDRLIYPTLESWWGVAVAQVVGFVIAQGIATTVNFVVQRTVIFR